METFDARPDRKRLSERELADFEQERQRRTQEKLAALPGERKDKVRILTGSLEESLVDYLGMPDADPQMLDRINGFLVQLGNSLLRAGDEMSSRGQKEDIEAGLLGASFVLDVSRETRFDLDPDRVPLMRRFLALVSERVTRLVELNERRK